MRTIVKKTIIQETKRHDFDNDFAYVEIWTNNHLKDNYFAEKAFLFPDGSLKKHAVKYFYSPYSGDEIEKEIEPVKYDKFNWFNKLYYFDEEGTILRIDGRIAAEIDYKQDYQADS